MIGIAYKYWGKYNEAQKEIQENIKLFEKLGDKNDVLSCLIVSGYMSPAWGNSDEVARICRKTLAMAKEQNNANAEGYSLLAMGNAFLSKNFVDSAYHYIEASRKKY